MLKKDFTAYVSMLTLTLSPQKFSLYLLINRPFSDEAVDVTQYPLWIRVTFPVFTTRGGKTGGGGVGS